MDSTNSTNSTDSTDSTIYQNIHNVITRRGFKQTELRKIDDPDTTEWSILAIRDKKVVTRDADTIHIPDATESTLVIRSIHTRFGRTLGTPPHKKLIKRWLKMCKLKHVRRVVIIADKLKVRTKMRTVTIRLDDTSPHGRGSSKTIPMTCHTTLDPHENNIYIRLILAERLMYNALDHELVPTHTPMRIPDLTSIIQIYNNTSQVTRKDILAFVSSIGSIHCNDPIVALLGGMPARSADSVPTVYEIRRSQGDVAYRAVTNDGSN